MLLDFMIFYKDADAHVLNDPSFFNFMFLILNIHSERIPGSYLSDITVR
jgi:hypothetical protein